MQAPQLQIVSIKLENATEFIFSKFQKCKGAAMVLNNLFSQPTSHSSSRIFNATRSTQIQKNSNANAQDVRQAKIFTSLHFLSTFSDEIYYRSVANADWLLEKEKNSNRKLIICGVRMWE